MSETRVGLVGAGAFGRNHLRVIHSSPHATLAGVYDLDPARAAEAARPTAAQCLNRSRPWPASADAAVVATPDRHACGRRMPPDGARPGRAGREADCRFARGRARSWSKPPAPPAAILQIGHLERFNPAVIALAKVVTKPLFFEIHRLSEFSPRSLDVDVVLDLMIHDIDIVLAPYAGNCRRRFAPRESPS